MILPDDVLTGVTNTLTDVLGTSLVIKDFSPVGGGCINHGGRLVTTEGDFFVKWNDATKYPGMFAAEAQGLQQLAAPGAIRIPRVISTGEHLQHQFIILEFIQSEPRSGEHWSLLGTQLATLHRTTQPTYGLDHNNYMGSMMQVNTTHHAWIDFFIANRLEAQLKRGTDNGAIPSAIRKKFNALYNRLHNLLITEPPALVHGDLWSGNLITDEKGNPCLIDPAVYFGHREVDLAMTQLFGGFDSTFYSAYQEAFPCEPGLQQRLDIYNLYPLLVHVNLFGQSYLHQVNSILNSLL